MAGAALDHRDLGVGDQAQHLGRLLADILGPRMTGDVYGDTAIQRLDALGQPFLLGDIDDVLADILGGRRQPLHILVVRQDQRPFEFQHQRAGRRQCHDVIALVDPGLHLLGDATRLLRHRFDVALFQLRHAAAGRIDHLGLDAVLRQHAARRHAGVRVVVVHEAGGIERRLAAVGRGGLVHLRHVALRGAGEGLGMEFRQVGALVDAGDALHDAAGQAVLGVGRPVGDAGNRGGQLAVAVGLGDLAKHEGGALLLPLDGAVAQHQMREIQVEFVRWHIGALGQEAHVAQRAGIHDRLEIHRADGIQLTRFGFVDQVEQPGEAVAQIEAAAAAMADVENPAQLLVELRLVIEIRVGPGQRVAGRRLETAFLHTASPLGAPGSFRRGND